MTDISTPALGLSGQGNSGLSTENPATTTAQNDVSAVTPSHVSAAEDGDERFWFPMRIAYGRAERTVSVKKFLDSKNVENFLPMKYEKKLIDGRRKLVKVPALDGLIFINTSESHLINIKRCNETLLPLRFMMWAPHNGDERPHIITVPQASMDNFMRVASVEDDRVMFLPNKDFSQKIGRRVRVTDGVFAGVEGTIYRVKKDRRVVVTLDQVCSVAIAYINPNYLHEIDE